MVNYINRKNLFIFASIIIFSILLGQIEIIKSQALNSSCPSYKCDTESDKKSSTCMKVSSESNRLVYSFKKCEDKNYYCPFNSTRSYLANESEVCAQRPQQQNINLLPGQKCSSADQCLSQDCHKKKCLGLIENEECTKPEECNIGLTCFISGSKGICQKQLDVDANCNNDTECLNNLICYEGKCALPYSKEDGQPVKDARMCKSQMAVDDMLVEITPGVPRKICDSYKLVDPTNTECDNRETCDYKFNKSGTIVPLSCKCAKTLSGKRVCPLDNDVEGNRNDEAFKLITVDNAHTLLRDINRWEGVKYNRFYPDKDMEKCVAETINRSQMSSFNLILMISFLIALFM